jgi:hypothetical protein
VLGPEHRHTVVAITTLARALVDQGKHADAEPLYRQALEVQRRVLGLESTQTRWQQRNTWQSHSTEATAMAPKKMNREVLGVQRRVLGREHPNDYQPG